MAATGKARRLPKLDNPQNLNSYDNNGDVENESATSMKAGKRKRTVKKSRTGGGLISDQDEVNNIDNKAPTTSTAIDEGVNPSHNSSNNASNSKRLTGKPRKKLRQKGADGSPHNISTASLRSGGTESGLGELSQSNSNMNGTSSKPRKKRRRKAGSGLASGKIESLGLDLADIQDDIIDEATDPDSDSIGQAPHKSHMKSQPIGKLYIEQTRGFKSTEKVTVELYSEEHRNKEANEDDEPTFPTKLSSMAFALTSIHVVKTFAHFCMGILAGLAIWQTLYAFTLTNMPDTGPFLQMYQYLSVPINCVFYIIIVFCTVATFDRYDVSKITRPCLLKACTLQSGAIAALLFTAALCVNVSMAPMDDRLGPKSNGTVDALRDFPSREDERRHLSIWRILSLVRTVLVGLAWFIISLRPSTDRLTKNLSQSEVTWGDKDERTNPLP